MKRSFLTPVPVAFLAGLVAVSPAGACISPAGVVAVIHNAVPERIPEGAVVLDVAFADDAVPSPDGVVAQVRRVVHGTFDGSELLVRVTRGTSCHYPFANGRSGLVVGRIREVDGSPSLYPYYVSRRHDFRMTSTLRR